ncbi:ATP-dependent Clp protease proteolytic subunit [Paenibacillus sp. JJ-100]|uniref:head maturation protease, ClpP-related n=1 Tax=Paenibacillus sp. JJ-100 TaxID=2974896 RepID=UPI0022FF97B0|nr:head maturation protease, ClpP-related [Paenibacillus sp. JJ-100]CAI6023351.1 ATP-dependent Clp protease proteolytic subunit [Paenibacillus sp. JJ-100]
MSEKRKKYWDFKAAVNGVGELYIYGDIVSWKTDDGDTSAKSFKSDLDALGDISRLNLYINSPGGSVFEGVAIGTMLKRHKAHITVFIDALAASIASVIAMAGDIIRMPRNAMMMIHNPWDFVIGNAMELRKAADDLDRIGISVKESYLAKTGDKLEDPKLTELLDAETWLSAQECLDYGLCDVIEAANQTAASVSQELFAKYRNVPKDIAAKLKEPEAPEASGNDEETTAYLQQIKDTAGLELQNINSYLGGIING